ncbi:MAG: metallophosphoesterase [Albidovulum sp.]
MTARTHFPLTRRDFLAGGAAGASLIALHPYSAYAAANQAHLRIMETTDIHVNVFPYDYYADKPNDTMGLSRTAALIDAMRAEATNAMLVDNGDFLQGNPMGDYIAYERGMKDGDVHPVIGAMNTLGYSASTLGNHEFNYGLDFLMDKALAGANFPIVSRQSRGAGPRRQSARRQDTSEALHDPRPRGHGRRRRGRTRSGSASSDSCRRRS